MWCFEIKLYPFLIEKGGYASRDLCTKTLSQKLTYIMADIFKITEISLKKKNGISKSMPITKIIPWSSSLFFFLNSFRCITY